MTKPVHAGERSPNHSDGTSRAREDVPLVARALLPHEQDIVRQLAEDSHGPVRLLLIAIANEIKQLDSLQHIDIGVDVPNNIVGEKVRAARMAYDTLLTIFESLGFGMMGELIHKHERMKKKSYR